MKSLRFLGSEIVLGSLIAVLSVLTAFSSYQGSIADSKQNENEIQAMKDLNDSNAAYLEANQFIVYDYTMYDGWYTSEPGSDKEQYYLDSFSEPLRAAYEADPENAFSDAYYGDMTAVADELYAKSSAAFDTAGQWDNRGDGLQLVVLITALGLAFAAWASLLKEESNMRVLFAALSIVMLVWGVISYLGVPAIAA